MPYAGVHVREDTLQRSLGPPLRSHHQDGLGVARSAQVPTVVVTRPDAIHSGALHVREGFLHGRHHFLSLTGQRDLGFAC